MLYIFIILIVIILIYFLFGRSGRRIGVTKPPINISHTVVPDIDIPAVTATEIHTDEKGDQYKPVDKTREIPRRTYILGQFRGKYWGEINKELSDGYLAHKFYEFKIYEAEVTGAESSSSPFDVKEDYRFPREKMPRLLPVIIQKDGKEYELNILEPIIANAFLDRKLHQEEGDEVFGTISAQITGYVLDFTTEHYTEREYIKPLLQRSIPTYQFTGQTKTYNATGNVEYKKNYYRNEYYYSDYKTTYWGSWQYRGSTAAASGGCVGSGVEILAAIFGIAVFIAIIPQLWILIPFALFPIMLGLLPEIFWRRIGQIIGVLFLLGFVISIISDIRASGTGGSRKRTTAAQDKPAEQKREEVIIPDNSGSVPNPDTLIRHFRSWDDYSGNHYEGYLTISARAKTNAHLYKNSLEVTGDNITAYDKLLYELKEFDKEKLKGVYHLFDSIKIAVKPDSKAFAEIIVSCVQDIPYAVILPDACNAGLYNDPFITKYLQTTDARCEGNEKFGINTPVEFMASLKGDCDSRTLLIYTILSHYNYDVALLSSEYYNHSLIGVNLPYEGTTYDYDMQRYVLWETTSPGFKPGYLPDEISNIDHWRISLKSK